MRRTTRINFSSVWLVMVGLALLHGCAPRLQEIGPPNGSAMLDGEVLVTADGAELPLRIWLPKATPRAVILGLHGFNDYSNAFAIPAESWIDNGVAVYAFDQRGFGDTLNRGLWPGTDVLVDDLSTAVALIRERHVGTPVYVVGVSMGGAVAITALARERIPDVAGTVLVGPAVWGRETMPLGHRILLWIASHTVPWQTVTGRGLDITPSDNIEMLRALGADPLVIKETRIDAIHGLVDLMDTALEAAPALQSPLLVLYGARDEIIPQEPTAAMLCALVAPRRVAVYENGYHMLLRDLQAEVVHRDVSAWIADPTRPLPSAAEKTTSDLLNCG